MVQVNNLSRGRQPVAVERFQKNRTLASFYLKAWDKLCLGDATTLFISASYLIEKHASKEIWGRWYPLCSWSEVPFIPREGTESRRCIRAD